MLTPEQLARQQLDALLVAGGWAVQDYAAYNPAATDGWTQASLDELAWHSSHGTSMKCFVSGNGAAVFRIPNVDRGEIDTTDIKYSADPLEVTSNAAPKAGDMLIIRTNGCWPGPISPTR